MHVVQETRVQNAFDDVAGKGLATRIQIDEMKPWV
jgi:hypothetical protein